MIDSSTLPVCETEFLLEDSLSQSYCTTTGFDILRGPLRLDSSGRRFGPLKTKPAKFMDGSRRKSLVRAYHLASPRMEDPMPRRCILLVSIVQCVGRRRRRSCRWVVEGSSLHWRKRSKSNNGSSASEDYGYSSHAAYLWRLDSTCRSCSSDRNLTAQYTAAGSVLSCSTISSQVRYQASTCLHATEITLLVPAPTRSHYKVRSQPPDLRVSASLDALLHKDPHRMACSSTILHRNKFVCCCILLSKRYSTRGSRSC